MTTTLPEPLAEDGSPKWHELRKTGIGASEIASACGISRYDDQLSLYLRKRGELEPVVETRAMRRGTFMQPFIADEFERDSGIKIVRSPLGLYRHPDHKWMLASPDALLETGDLGEWKDTKSFQVKALLASMGELPAECSEWHMQIQQQIEVCGVEAVWIAVAIDDQLKTFRVMRNDRLIASIIRVGGELWDRIVNGNPPPMDYSHPRSSTLVKEMFGDVDDTRIELAQADADAWLDHEELGAQIRDAKKRQSALKTQVLAAIGNNGEGVLPGHERMVRRREQTRKEHVVAESTFIVTLAVKYDGGIITETERVSP